MQRDVGHRSDAPRVRFVGRRHEAPWTRTASGAGSGDANRIVDASPSSGTVTARRTEKPTPMNVWPSQAVLVSTLRRQQFVTDTDDRDPHDSVIITGDSRRTRSGWRALRSEAVGRVLGIEPAQNQAQQRLPRIASARLSRLVPLPGCQVGTTVDREDQGAFRSVTSINMCPAAGLSPRAKALPA